MLSGEMNVAESSFYITGGTLRNDAPCYVERQADRELLAGLLKGEFCYVLTSRQMGKSSLMVRATGRLREQGINVIVLDLTAVGLNVTPEQWYDGLMVRMGRQLRLEDELDDFWASHERLSPVQRFLTAVREIGLARRPGQLVIFVDEIDTVRSLPFATDEFFAAIRECYNRRVEDPELNRLTFCLLGVATPADLIRDPRTTPFNIGRRIELNDFTEPEAAPLAKGLENPRSAIRNPQLILERILYWTHGHPYLTQRLCCAVAEANADPADRSPAIREPEAIDHLCDELFLSPRARERDDNLLFVRERILRSETDLAGLLELYEQIHENRPVPDDETNELINHLRLAGIVQAVDGCLRVRNRIYDHVFDRAWIRANMPDAELVKPNGERVRIKETCSLGRIPANEIPLPDEKVSRRHALIRIQGQNEFWLADLGSSNGTYLNGRRITQAVLLHDQDQIEIGPFRLIFRQARTAKPAPADQPLTEKTIQDIKACNCWMLLAAADPAKQPGRPVSPVGSPDSAGAWLDECQRIISDCGGRVHRSLADHVFVYWPERETSAVARALATLKQLQEKGTARFRIVAHHGQVFVSGAGRSGEESLLGKEVNFVLSLEKLAQSLNEPRLLSEAARALIKPNLPLVEAGRHVLEGFENPFLVFRF